MRRYVLRKKPAQIDVPTGDKKLPPQFSISLSESELSTITEHAQAQKINNRSQFVRECVMKYIHISSFNLSVCGIEFTITGNNFAFAKLISACGRFVDAHPQNVLLELPNKEGGDEFRISGAASDIASVHELITLVQAASETSTFELTVKGEKNETPKNTDPTV